MAIARPGRHSRRKSERADGERRRGNVYCNAGLPAMQLIGSRFKGARWDEDNLLPEVPVERRLLIRSDREGVASFVHPGNLRQRWLQRLPPNPDPSG